MRALVIEDTRDIAECIVQSLADMGITSDWFAEGKYVESAFAVAEYDVVVLDLNLPDSDGLQVLKKLRNAGNKTPVLVISARITVADRVSGLDLGADDYLVKPFALEEFEARIRVLLRREFASHSSTCQYGDLLLNLKTREFFINEQPLELSGRERSVLEILIQKQGSPVSKETIATHIFNFDDDVDLSAIEIYIHRLRKKLSGKSVAIVTNRGVGYSLCLHEQV